MRAFRLAVAVVSAAVALAPAASPASAPSGLAGTTRISPSTPVCRVGTPCSAPAYVELVFTRAGARPSRTHTTRSGAYRILLRPGIYAVTTSLVGPGHTPKPAHVHVRAGHVDRLAFTIDTGIR